MADAIKKFLTQVTAKEAVLLLVIAEQIREGKIQNLEAKKLIRTKNVFRVKRGMFRIIYKQTKTGCVVIDITRRSEKTYRDF